jgi:acylphosphatase
MAAANSSQRSELARAHVWVTGRVQGVGFRAFVAYSAQRLNVTGWVRNVGYNTVEVLAEGTGAQIEQFVQLMRTGPRNARVDESRVEIETHSGEFADFQIRASR